jgi:predicted Zn-dependent protease
MLLSPAEARQITDRLLSTSKADSCVVTIEGRNTTNLRFARNNGTTNGSHDKLSVSIRSDFAGRSCSASTNDLDTGALAQAQQRSEAMARLAPVNPEFMPPLGPQQYAEGRGYDEPSAGKRASDLAAAARVVIQQAVERNINTTGYAETGPDFTAMATSAGLFAYHRSTQTRLSITARNSTGSWSGWAGSQQTRFDQLDAARLGARAIEKASFSTDPVDLDPGKYTVILEPSAVADLVTWLLWNFDARFADEGRSFLAKKGGGSKLGEKLFHDAVTITSDPSDPVVPEPVYGTDGVPQKRIAWIEDGTVRNLAYTRFWAQKTGREPLSYPQTFVMRGGSTSIDDMIKDTKRGVLVTRLWYIREVDPRTLLLTGLTRDGNFLIENGRIQGPAVNFRFNESPIAMLSNIAAIGPSERTHGGEADDASFAAPPLLVKEFTFSSKARGI